MSIPDPAASGGPAVDVRGLRVRLPSPAKGYAPPREVVRGLTFAAPAGQVTAVVGTNGAGKTTTLRAVVTALPFSEGSIEVLGTDVGPAGTPLPAGAAHVPDDPVYPEHWTAHDNARIRGRLDPAFDLSVFDAALAAHRVPHHRRRRELSRGQITQTALAAALAQDPRLLILDEPFARLDPLARTELVDELRTFMTGEDRSILLSTHDLEGMERFVDHLVVIADGQEVLTGSIESLREEFLLLETADTRQDVGGQDVGGKDVSIEPGSPLIGATSHGGTLRALVHLEEAAGLPPASDLRRPDVHDLVTHWLRAARADEHGARRPAA